MNKRYLSTILLLIFFTVSTLPSLCIEDTLQKPCKNLKTSSAMKQKKVYADKKLEYTNLGWWNRFNDPILNDYILKTSEGNYDIKINELKVLQSKEAVKEGTANLLPVIDFAPDATRMKGSGNVPFRGRFSSTYYVTSIEFPINVNYELDIWGKNRFAVKKLKKDYEALQYDEKAAFISLTVLTASTYFNILNLDKQIEIQEELVKIRKEILDLTRVNFDYGLNSSMDVVQSDKLYAESLLTFETLQNQRNQLLNQLSVLIGNSSENSSELQRTSISEINLIDDLPQSIETEIINQRPDILKAEAQLQAAMFDVKAARRNLLPSINLTGAFGFNAYRMEKMFNWESFIMTLGAGLTQPVFRGGKLMAQLKGKKYKYDEMFNNYQKVILTSIQEINDSLANVKTDNTKYSTNIRRLNDETKYYNDASFKYKKGAVSYLDTLRFKEALLTTQQDEIQSKTDCLIDTLSLYKSVGGKL